MIETVEEIKPIIKVIGVGGGGGNAANYMYRKGIVDVDFVICNTDKKALLESPIPTKVMLGEKGLGAGSKPEIGRQAAIERLDEIQKILEDSTEMVFVTAGMGGGTGTGAAPVIAKAAKDKGILTIGIVTIPFVFEGHRRVKQALEGLEEMRKSVDSIIIITNERIKELYGDLTMSKAFSQADNILATAAKGIAELITITGYVNVDLEDVRTVMTDSGDAIMGSAIAEGPDRAINAIKEALNSPLLINNDISSSENVLLNISSGEDEFEATMDETSIITDYLQENLKEGAQIIWGNTKNKSLEDKLQVTIVVTGLNLTDDELSTKKTKAEPKENQTHGLFGGFFESKPTATKKDDSMVKMSDQEASRMAETIYGRDVFSEKPKANPIPEYKPVAIEEAPITVTFDNNAQQPQQPMQQATQQPVEQPMAQPVAQQPIVEKPVQKVSLADLLKNTDQFENNSKL